MSSREAYYKLQNYLTNEPAEKMSRADMLECLGAMQEDLFNSWRLREENENLRIIVEGVVKVVRSERGFD